MSRVSGKASCLAGIALLFLLGMSFAQTLQVFSPESVPPKFNADAEFAARIRSVLLPYTEPAIGEFATGAEVMETLLKQLPAHSANFSWDLRIAKDAGNVFSSPDGTIFVDEQFASMLGEQSGLWAAALSHEIAHVIRRDWARRYLFQKSLTEGAASQVVLGDTGAFSGSWVDGRTSSSLLANFSQNMELEADAEGMMLMARAGFHPDFVPALHHLLQAQEGQSGAFDPSHPSWAERDEKLQRNYASAGREFDRVWPARDASPGGNPPTVVYAGLPSERRHGNGDAEVLIPLHCQNLSGSVEVVLSVDGLDFGPLELRQFTGCTSNRTLIVFALPAIESLRSTSRLQGDVLVLNDSGEVLTRSAASLAVR